MKKSMKRTLLLSLSVMCIIIPTGCWDMVEINELAIANLVGVDYDPQNKTQSVYFQIVNPKAVSGQNNDGIKSPVYTFHADGIGSSDITSELTDYMPRKLFPNHYQAMIVSERFAKEGLLPLLNLFERLYDRRSSLAMFVTDNSVSDVMQTYLPLDRLPGNYLRNLIEMQFKSVGRIHQKCRLKDMVENLESKKSTVLPVISIFGSAPEPDTKRYEQIEANKGNLYLSGAAIFNKDRMVGKIPLDELPYYRLLEEKKGVLSETVVVNGKMIQVRGVKPKVKRKLKMGAGIPEWDVKIKINVQLLNDESSSRLTTSEIKRIENAFNKQVEEKCTAVFHKALQNDWDLFGLQNRIKYKRGRQWEMFRNTETGRKQTKLRINVNSRTTEVGEIIDPYV